MDESVIKQAINLIDSGLFILLTKNDKGEDVGIVGMAQMVPLEALFPNRELVVENVDTSGSDIIS